MVINNVVSLWEGRNDLFIVTLLTPFNLTKVSLKFEYQREYRLRKKAQQTLKTT